MGQLFVDTAELDDISGILAIGVLLALLPQLAGNGLEGGLLLRPTGLALGKLLVFGLGMLLFARYLCPPMLRWIRRFEHGPDPMLSVIGLGLVFAAVAAMADLSLSIGAFLAGLAFSGDRQAVREDLAFDAIYDLFTPFFFLIIGMQFDVTALGPAVALAVPVLLAAAVAGKVVGTSGPALAFVDRRAALTLGVSMIPRAEVAMIIGDRVHNLQPELMSDTVYGALVMVCLLSSLSCAGALPRLIDGGVTAPSEGGVTAEG